MKEQRPRAGKNRNDSWEKLKKHLRKDFLPYNYFQTVYTRFQNLRQGNRSVDNYAADFFSFLARSNLQEKDKQLVSRFIDELRQELQYTLIQFNPPTVSEAHQRALLMEQQPRNSPLTWESNNTKHPR